MDGPCPFCTRLATLKTQPASEVVWEFPHSIAFLGGAQFYTGYCLLVSRHHATELSQLNDMVRLAFLDEMCLLARAIELAYHPLKLNYELLGNQVPHLHWHVIPRYEHDPERLKPVWLALEAAERDPVLRRRLEGTADRTVIRNDLRRRLEALNAPQA